VPAAAVAPQVTAKASKAPNAATVTITAVGDTMLGNTPDLPPDPATYFDAVKTILDPGAQIVFGNLEGTLTTSTTSKCGVQKGPDETCFAFRDPPGYARYFKAAGFTILNDANNHSFDFGAAGQAQTVQVIHAAGLAQTGLPGEITLVSRTGSTSRSWRSRPTATMPISLTCPRTRPSSGKPGGRQMSSSCICMPARRVPKPIT